VNHRDRDIMFLFGCVVIALLVLIYAAGSRIGWWG
jgi:hypothetical protein